MIADVIEHESDKCSSQSESTPYTAFTLAASLLKKKKLKSFKFSSSKRSLKALSSAIVSPTPSRVSKQLFLMNQRTAQQWAT